MSTSIHWRVPLLLASAALALACGSGGKERKHADPDEKKAPAGEEREREGRREARGGGDQPPEDGAPVPIRRAPAPAPKPPPTDGSIAVNPDGSFSPAVLHVKAGEVVRWTLGDRADSVVAGTGCGAAAPFDRDVLAVPNPTGPSGIYVLGPNGDEPGSVSTDTGRCSDGTKPGREVGGRTLCKSGPLGAPMLETWQSPDITGVHVRLTWKQIEPKRGQFDFESLGHQLDAAAAYGKLVSLSIKAGDDGTPDWIFEEGVERLTFQDRGSKSDKCGVPMSLGDPTNPAFRALWGEMLEGLATFVRSRADWYRSIAYVRLGGANLFSAEARLPNHCGEDCPICNTEVWAKAGYRPSKLYAFYDWQEQLLAERFPGKTMSLQIIQAGLPRINEEGCWLIGDPDDPGAKTGCPSGVRAGIDDLPKGTEQTEGLIERAARNFGPNFQIAHNGLGPAPTGERCPTFGKHPAKGPYGKGEGDCPNKWVLEAGAKAGVLTAFQTNNEKGVGSPDDLEATLQNGWDSSDAVSIEIYESLFWELSMAGRKLHSGQDPRRVGRPVPHPARRAVDAEDPRSVPGEGRAPLHRARDRDLLQPVEV